MADNECYVEVLSASGDVWQPAGNGRAVIGRIRVKVHGSRSITPSCRLETDSFTCGSGVRVIKEDRRIQDDARIAAPTSSRHALLVKRVFSDSGAKTDELRDGEEGFIEIDDQSDLVRNGVILDFTRS